MLLSESWPFEGLLKVQSHALKASRSCVCGFRRLRRRNSCSSRLPSLSCRIHRVHQRRAHKVLAEEPHLHLVPTQNVADDKIIGDIIPEGRGTTRKLAALPDEYLVGIQQP